MRDRGRHRVQPIARPAGARHHYNHLNLPTKIYFQNGDYIDYIYTAGGTKIRKDVHDGSAMRDTDYLDGYQYVKKEIKFFPTSEGYVSCIPTSGGNNYRYVYNYKDHLGNIRMCYGLNEEQELTILEENHYYPFGLKHTNYNPTIKEWGTELPSEEVLLREAAPSNPVATSSYKYKFNGVEWQDDLALNLFDMDMRDYDPAIGRWLGIDPVTHHSMSPYVGMDNNPVLFADPSGANVIIIDMSMVGNGVSTFSSDGDGGFTPEGFESDEEIAINAKNGPGAPFSSELGAAVGFAMTYNTVSYQKSTIGNPIEIVSLIYSVMKGSVKTYSYVEPEICGGLCGDANTGTVAERVNKRPGAKPEAWIHTHGGEVDPSVLDGTMAPYNNGFSEPDKTFAWGTDPNNRNPYHKPMKVYVASADGNLRLYNPLEKDPKYWANELFNKPVYSGLPADKYYRKIVTPKKR
ncbi:RHS repeat domain-containing protein [Flavobacterium sp.]|uniref:RHS repeat domain-containing protein n=1 Tax=Flavobacterium sp. TaxID=239 RepID=UPI0039E6C3AD